MADVNKLPSAPPPDWRQYMFRAVLWVAVVASIAYAASQGKTMYPDANGSLRFTYGKVTGKAVDGQVWTPFTTAEGLVAKQTGKGDFAAPQKAIDLIKAGRPIKYTGATGPLEFDANGDVTGPALVWKITGGKIETDRIISIEDMQGLMKRVEN